MPEALDAERGGDFLDERHSQHDPAADAGLVRRTDVRLALGREGELVRLLVTVDDAQNLCRGRVVKALAGDHVELFRDFRGRVVPC